VPVDRRRWRLGSFGGRRTASTGDYRVVLQVGGTTIKQTLHVEDRTGR
jgi:hypothetical protein